MPNREFIHATSDVASTLLYALDSGLQVMLDESQAEPRPCMLMQGDVADIKGGVFFLFRPEWVFGPFETMRISGGYNLGKYSVQPRVNHTAVTAYFGGERIDEGHRRFGSCAVSCHGDWLEMPTKIVRPTPPDVRDWWKRIVAHLSSGVVIKAGVHRYHVARGVLADPSSSQCLPPFDFIPWGSEVLAR